MSSSVGVVVAKARPYRVFIATWAGWMLDGFDNAIYIYVIVPALTELLPKSGFVADHAHVARLGGLMFSLFILGCACSMFWGWCADRSGRVLGAAGPAIVGALAAMFGSYPLAISAVSLIYLVGLFCVKWAPETAHQVLQE